MTAENRRILIIDDERTILLTLEALLGRHGYQPETAATAAHGLRMLQKNPPAVVLLDLQLPDADGLQMLDQIKQAKVLDPWAKWATSFITVDRWAESLYRDLGGTVPPATSTVHH